MSETLQAERWLYGILSNDATLAALVGTRIFAYLAPQDTQYPLVVFAFEDGEDEQGIGGMRLNSILRYSVKAVGEGSSFTAIEPIATRIDALLHAKAGAITGGGYVQESIRVSPVAMVELGEGGTQYRHLGGVYQLRIQGA